MFLVSGSDSSGVSDSGEEESVERVEEKSELSFIGI
jgi:hypothetical protein